MVFTYRKILFFSLLAYSVNLPLFAADIQFLNEADSGSISYERFCELMEQQANDKVAVGEGFCTEANVSMHTGLPFVKSMAQLFSLHGAILQENTTNEGTSGDGLAHDGPRFFGSVFFNTLDAKGLCQSTKKLSSCDDIHKFLEEEIQRSFFFVRSKKTDQYYYFTNVKESASGETDVSRSILLGEFTLLDSSLHGESRKIFREYARKYGKPNHDSRHNDIVDSSAWKDKTGRYLYLVRFKIGEDLMHNFSGLQEFSVEKVYASTLYNTEISRLKQRVSEKAKTIKKEKDAEQKRLLQDAIK